MRFINTGGRHTGPDGKVTNRGGIVESEIDLTVVFRNKFQRVATDGNFVVDPPNIPMGQTTPQKRELQEPVWGEDVTDAIEFATGLDITVYKKLGWYSVINNETDESLTLRKMRIDELREFLSTLKAPETKEPNSSETE